MDGEVRVKTHGVYVEKRNGCRVRMGGYFSQQLVFYRRGRQDEGIGGKDIGVGQPSVYGL